VHLQFPVTVNARGTLGDGDTEHVLAGAVSTRLRQSAALQDDHAAQARSFLTIALTELYEKIGQEARRVVSFRLASNFTMLIN